MYCIDLFAGCGGLSLGLEQSGFTPLLFSELNHSAAETYLINRQNLNLTVVGDIFSLTNENIRLLKTYWKIKGIYDVDLVSGGPPCQGYSGIGHRRTFKLDRKEIPSNHLYEEMVRVISQVQPKAFLFENVKGLLSARWVKNGKKGEIFCDVLRAFKTLANYQIRWDLVQAKNYGVPQNRPRVFIVGYRNDVLFPKNKYLVCNESELSYDGPSGVKDGFLPKPSGNPPTLPELLSDLEDPNYRRTLVTKQYPHPPLNDIQKRFRTHNGSVADKGGALTEQEYSDHADYIRQKYSYMIQHKGAIPKEFQTKKFAQRVFPLAWEKNGPGITVTSLPEDYVHYSQPRSPTVREWARIQTFPDWYQFAGSRTTGGRRRAGDPSKGLWERDVPRYTQIGNAVPPMLAEKVGLHIRKILDGSFAASKK
jgi:DNA (cytosine-5)-methyltransferase 1